MLIFSKFSLFSGIVKELCYLDRLNLVSNRMLFLDLPGIESGASPTPLSIETDAGYCIQSDQSQAVEGIPLV